MKKKVTAIATVAILSTSISTNTLASTYFVQKGDTLTSIASKHKTTINEIKTLNNLKSDALFIKQPLILKETASLDSQKDLVSTESNNKTYTVMKGDTLIKIANKHGITLAELKDWNNLTKDTIYVGQSLIVSKDATPPKEEVKPPAPTKPPSDHSEYVIKSGDSLSKIAAQFNMTVEQLKTINQLKTDMIFAGQKLLVTGPLNPVAEQKPSLNENNVASESLLINEAKKLLGTPYLFGGSNANAFDCSGFIYYVFNKSGKAMSRLSAAGYYDRSFYVDSPLPGDLVFFENTYKPGISHMGIYIGDNQFIHAGPTNGVEISSLNEPYFKKHFESFKRFY